MANSEFITPNLWEIIDGSRIVESLSKFGVELFKFTHNYIDIPLLRIVNIQKSPTGFYINIKSEKAGQTAKLSQSWHISIHTHPDVSGTTSQSHMKFDEIGGGQYIPILFKKTLDNNIEIIYDEQKMNDYVIRSIQAVDDDIEVSDNKVYTTAAVHETFEYISHYLSLAAKSDNLFFQNRSFGSSMQNPGIRKTYRDFGNPNMSYFSNFDKSTQMDTSIDLPTLQFFGIDSSGIQVFQNGTDLVYMNLQPFNGTLAAVIYGSDDSGKYIFKRTDKDNKLIYKDGVEFNGILTATLFGKDENGTYIFLKNNGETVYANGNNRTNMVVYKFIGTDEYGNYKFKDIKTGNIIFGGNSDYKQKYLKYKQKYLELKKKLENNNF